MSKIPYEIVSIRTNGEHLQTVISFEYDGIKNEFDQAHFQEKTIEDIYANIEKRIASEITKIEAIKNNDVLKASLDKDIKVKKETNIKIKNGKND
jgi:hypothetical protein